MLKKILTLEGTQKLNINELKATMGGKVPPCCLEWNPITKVCYVWDQACLGN